MVRVEVVAGRPGAGVDTIIPVVKSKKPVAAGIPLAEFEGKKYTMALARRGTTRILYVGVGDKATVCSGRVRKAVGAATKQLLRMGASNIAVVLNDFSQHAQAAVEGAVMASYRFEDFKEPKARRKNALRSLRITVNKADLAQARTAARNGNIIATAVNYARQIGNLPPNVLYPSVLAEKAQALAKECQLGFQVWDEDKLERQKFGGILAVGRGSAKTPRLIALEYRPAGTEKIKPVVLIGKSITFDSGGISIKPADGMEAMKFDKMGGCAVLGAMKAVAALKLPFPVIGLLGAAENMPGMTAYRPGDIVTTYDGKTIEVISTDAEGRVVLADVLAYARKHYQPRLMIDLATLTGAAVVALGNKRAALFSTDDELAEAILKAGRESGEAIWRLPLGEDYDDLIKSDVATAKNSGGRWGGACTAAAFLQKWAEDTPWAHIDMAGPGIDQAEVGHLDKGATGYGVRLIIETLRQLK
jgi:leucyl aminopeptidase